MQGDFSRNTFDPRKHYRSVRMQQGRVQLDSDWNEQADIVGYLFETQMRDLLGPSGAPSADAGFAIALDGDADDAKPGEQPGDLPDFWIGAGRFYVDGMLCENEQPVRFGAQPYSSGATPTGERADAYVVYLDVWQRHVTAAEAPWLRDVALGGIDTTTRVQTIWQVKVLPSAAPPDEDAPSFEETTELAAWAKLVAARGDSACIRVRRQANGATLDNRLYRVEIHQAGEDQATFKWSRENGSVVLQVADMRPLADQPDATQLLVTLDHPGRGGAWLQAGDWVEIVDEIGALSGAPGSICQVVGAPDWSRGQLTLSCERAREIGQRGARPGTLLRRWDQNVRVAKQLVDGAIPIRRDTWIEIESGIQVWFSPDGALHPGDYWSFPARSLTGDVEWPRDGQGPVARPPDGVSHHYSPLALIHPREGRWNARDLRRIFTPLPLRQPPAERPPDAPRCLSELCDSPDQLEPGDLVALVEGSESTVEKASDDNARLTFGVVSAVEGQRYRVTIYGRAGCKVVGPVRAGDLLTAAETPGCARPVNIADQLFRPGTIIGKSLVTYADDDDDQIGGDEDATVPRVVNILVTLQ